MQDLDGDGDVDVLYHPNFVAGFGLAQPWMTSIQTGTTALGAPLFSPYLPPPDGSGADSDLDWQTSVDPLQMRQGATQYVDVDADGLADRVLLVPYREEVKNSTGISATPRPGFDAGNPDCVKWARIGPKVYPIPPFALPEGWRHLGDFSRLPSAEVVATPEISLATSVSASSLAPPLMCSPVVPDSTAIAESQSVFAFAQTRTLDFLTQPAPAGLDTLPPTFDIAFDPVIDFGLSPRPPPVPPPSCPTNPIGPIGPVIIDGGALTLAHNGALAVQLDRLMQLQVEPQLASLGAPFDGNTTGYRTVVAMPTPDGCPDPMPVPISPIPGLPPPRPSILPECIPLPNKVCLRIPRPGGPPDGPPLGVPGTRPPPPKTFNINTFDPSICFTLNLGGLDLRQNTQPARLIVGRNGGRQADGAKDRFLQDYPRIGAPSYFEDIDPSITDKDQRIQQILTNRSVDMPIVDLDNDGLPEVVVLKSNKTYPSRLFADEWFGAGVWRVRGLEPISESSYSSVSETRFRSSLDEILTIDRRPTSALQLRLSLVPDFSCAAKDPLPVVIGGISMSWPMIRAQKLLEKTADWVSMLLDVNADGLPDLVLAKGATCTMAGQGRVGTTDHRPGFDVHLNRGDRFETSAEPGLAYTTGPFSMVRNWTAGTPSDPGVPFVDDARYPLSTLAFSDLDGDGASDAVLYARIGWPRDFLDQHGPSRWPSDPTACVPLETSIRGPLPPVYITGLHLSLVRCVWRGGAAGWRGARDLAAKLPSLESSVNNAYVQWGTDLTKGRERLRWVDAAGVPDLARFADLDNDGVLDLVATRAVGRDRNLPETDPTRVHRRDARRPDLLQAIDNGVGHLVSVAYRPARRGELTRVPMVPWVVDRIVSDPYRGIPEGGAREERVLSYSGGTFDFKEREFLGFATLSSSHAGKMPDGTAIGTRVEEQQFYLTEQSIDRAQNPLKGLLKATLVHDREGRVERIRTENKYEVVPPQVGGIYRVRATSTVSAVCPAAGCTAEGPRVTQTTTYDQFDDYDNARRAVTVATRQGIGDSFDGTIALTETRTFQNNLEEWILGQVKTYTRSDGARTLQSTGYDYQHDRVIRITDQRLGVLGTCDDSVTAFIAEREYNGVGNLVEERNNNHLIAGGARPLRNYIYEMARQAYPEQIIDRFTKGSASKTLVTTLVFDHRFGLAANVTDPNGHTTQRVFDTLGRVHQIITPERAVVREFTYDLSTRPTTTTRIDDPGLMQPTITRVFHFDGLGRQLQATTFTQTGAVVDAWARFGTLGAVAESAMPFETGGVSYRPRRQIPTALVRMSTDVLGRPLEVKLVDERTLTTAYEIGSRTTTNARAVPRTEYVDALGRVTAVDESYRPAGSREPFATHRTRFTRDGDGRILTRVDAEQRTRSFSYNHLGEITTASTATGDYQFCYDGQGAATKMSTPAGRVVRQTRDELGRLIARTHEPAARFGGDDVVFAYDDPLSSNGNGRLTSISGQKTSATFNYDVRGNVSATSLTTAFGADAGPWRDGTYTSGATYDHLGRPIHRDLPYDPQQVRTPASLDFSYNERGQLVAVNEGETGLVGIDEFNAAGQPLSLFSRNGTSTRFTYDVNLRMETATTKGPQSVDAPTVLHYEFQYDFNDNPFLIDRLYGSGLAAATVRKAYRFDSLDRVESGSIEGVEATTRTLQYSYSPGGNLKTADRFTNFYTGADPHAVSSRLDSLTGQTTTFSYDLDGQMTGASGPAGDEIQTWDGEGRLTRVTTAASRVDLLYDAGGGRILKKVTGTPRQSLPDAPAAGYADITLGDLELRGAATSAGEIQGFYNVPFGSSSFQLALRRDADGLLTRDPAADRTYHSDYLGSTALVTGSDGLAASPSAATGRLEYGPYGEVIASDAGTGRIRYRFNGKEMDETGLAYYGARYADQSLGRWTSRDPVALFGPDVVGQAANLYAFSNNNPVRFVDPFGLSSQESAKEPSPPKPPKDPDTIVRGETIERKSGPTTVTTGCTGTCPNSQLDGNAPSAPSPSPKRDPPSADERGRGSHGGNGPFLADATTTNTDTKGSPPGSGSRDWLTGEPGKMSIPILGVGSVGGDPSKGVLQRILAWIRGAPAVVAPVTIGVLTKFTNDPARLAVLQQIYQNGLRTSDTVARQLAGPRSFIPVQSILQTVGNGLRSVDPQGVANQFMYSANAVVNGSRGLLEVLVNERSGQVFHVLFRSGVSLH